MRIVSTHLKGGVGKSTTAIHVTGALLTEGSVLLLDGDQGATSYRFFSGDESPLEAAPRPIEGFEHALHIAPARVDSRAGLVALNRAVREVDADYVVVDTTPKLTEVSGVLAELRPDLLVVSVKRDDRGSLTLLPELAEAIRQLGSLGVRPAVRLVPIGLGAEDVAPYLQGAEVDIEVAPTVPYRPDEAGTSVFEGPHTGGDDHRFIWEVPGCETFFGLYYDLVRRV